MAGLIIKNDGIGDLVLSSGLISEACRLAGPVDLVTCRQNRSVAERIVGVREVIYVDRDSLRFSHKLARRGILVPVGSRKDLAAVGRLLTRSYDWAVSLRHFIRASSLALMRCVRARVRIYGWTMPTNIARGLAEKASRGWTRVDVGSTRHELHVGKLLIEHALERAIDRPMPRLRGVRVGTASDEKTAALAIGGSSSRWPTRHWLSLADALLANDWRLEVYCTSRESAAASSLVALDAGRVRAHTETRNIVDAARQASKASIVVGNDTGIMHLAALLHPRCVVILGGGTFGRFFPWPDATNQFAICHALRCYDCNWDCIRPTVECLDRVTPEQVYKYIGRVRAGDAKPGIWNVAESSVAFENAWRFGNLSETRVVSPGWNDVAPE